jgi:hypothetical protein
MSDDEYDGVDGGDYGDDGDNGDDGDDRDDGDEKQDNYELRAEIDAYNRVSQGNLNQLLSGNKYLTPKDRFLINTYKLCQRMTDENIYNLKKQLNVILEKGSELKNIEYKNHVAYVLGYIASDGGRNIKEKTIKEVIDNILPQLGDDIGIEPADIIRYARHLTMCY